MIDCANEVYTRVATAVRAQFARVDCSGDYTKTPSVFPHVSVIEEDNAVLPRKTTGDTEMAQVTFNVNVYSNKQGGKKSECRAIMAVVDRAMYSMNALRTFMHPVPNLQNNSIYRLTAQYVVVTDGKLFYRR